MRIGLLIYGSLEQTSGGYLYDRKLVEYLRRQGDQVEIVSLPWRNYLRHLGDNFSPAFYRRLAQLDLDILLQDELNHPSLVFINRILRKQAAYPILAIVHHLRSSEERPAAHNRLYRWFERRYLAGLWGFIYNSQTTRQAVERLAGNRPCIVAYPAGDHLDPDVSESQIALWARESGPLRLLFLGNIISRKGLHHLLAAVDQLPREIWRLDVAGSPEIDRDYTAVIHRQVRAAGLGDRVRFLGSLDEPELRAQLRSSQVLVVPSSYEGFGIVYLEGMGFGLPAVASTAGAAHEIITDGLDGFLVPPGDAQALAGRLRQLAEDRERLLRMSLAARRRFCAHPTWEETGRQVRDFLLRAIS